ncbi:MAG TPA: CARDB domain-containing protein [Thermoanaerobaculaceae bacterium]|nr:CARDB domain-containing protein [Thermoanaerobaculaceae bacterium]
MAGNVRVLAKFGCLVVLGSAVAAQAGAQGFTKPSPVPTVVQKGLPDLLVAKINFQFVKHLTSGSGGVCDLFNVVPTIANQGKASARGFKVGLEWNRGIGGTFVPACPSCSWQVPGGLAAGASQALQPIQFNNCDWQLTFKVTADSENSVAESNEHNNSSTAAYVPKPVH